MLVPDLHARVSLFDIRNQPIIHLGDDSEWRQQVLANNFQMRGEPSRWLPECSSTRTMPALTPKGTSSLSSGSMRACDEAQEGHVIAAPLGLRSVAYC